MLGTIKIMFDYGAYPIWYQYNNEFYKNGIPKELDNINEIQIIFDDINKRYIDLFIDNKIEFTYCGFKCESDRTAFLSLLNLGIEKLQKSCENKFILIDKSYIL